ncbi:MAG: NAD(P)/FAD-dependent oxidoreductase [Ilumatobacteraceae bacterium]
MQTINTDTPGVTDRGNSRGAKPNVVVVGSSFAGLTAALEAKHRLKDRAYVTVIDQRDYFTFIPSLIWVPFGKRSAEDITFPLEPMYRKQGIRFVHARAERFDLAGQIVVTDHGDIGYDRLVIATGPKLAFERIPGLGPHGGHTQSVCTLDHTLETRAAWQRFLADPGPVVVGTAQGGSCFGASYEFLLNTRYQLQKAGHGDQPVTFITSEPFLGHFGLGGVGDSERRVERLFAKLGIRGIPNTSIDSVSEGEIRLGSGEALPFAFSMIVPPFTGVDAVTRTEGLANPAGFIPVTDEYRHPDHPDVFAAGVDIAIAPPQQTLVPTGVPKTGHMSEHMAKIAAANIAADLGVGEHQHVSVDELGAICILDAGNTGLAIKTDRVLGGGKHTHVMAGPQAHWAKVAFERFFLTSRRHGLVAL